MDVRVGLWRKLSTEKLMLLNHSVEEDSWESLGLQEIKPFNPKGNQSWMFIGRTDFEADAPIFWPPGVKNWLIWKDPDAGKDWSQEEKGTTEDEMVGCITDLMDMRLSKLRELVINREAWHAAVNGFAVGHDWVTELSCYLTFAWLWKWVLPYIRRPSPQPVPGLSFS